MRTFDEVVSYIIGRCTKLVKTHSETLIIISFLLGISSPADADHLSGGFGIGESGPIVTESAVPLKSGRWTAGIRSEFVDNHDFTDADLISLRGAGIDRDGEADEDLHSIGAILGVSLRVSYGLTDNLTVGLKLPYVGRNDIREPEDGHAHAPNPIVVHDIVDHGNTAGMGDLTLLGLYRFYHEGDHELSMLFGLKAPTGDTNETGFENEYEGGRYVTQVFPDDHDDGHHHDGTLLETHQQPGSGSWDGSLGLAYRFNAGQVKVYSSFLYTVVTEGSQDTNLGDSFGYNLAVSRPTTHMAPCDLCSWDLILELNGEWRERETRDGEEVGNSGVHVVYLSPGLRLNFGNDMSMSMSFGYPVVNNVNGDQSEPDYRLIGAISYGF